MCGIFVVASAIAQSLDIEPALDVIATRGPDASGVLYWNENQASLEKRPNKTPATIALGHRRLSIIDLSEASNQPLISVNQRHGIVFNGEIYNYIEIRKELLANGATFRTNSDTEVILNSYIQFGINKTLELISGMFSFVIFDSIEKKLVFARDPFGIKPLYYTKTENGYLFGSEPRQFLEYNRITPKINPESAWSYLKFGLTDHGNNTLFASISQIPAGHWGSLSYPWINTELHTEPYWTPKTISSHPNGRLASDSIKTLRDTFLSSVDSHLRSDVPVGVALSGGIDSSSIACAIRHLYPQREIHTFSYIPNDVALSEIKYINEVNRHIDAIPHHIEINNDDLPHDLADLMSCQGEPFGSTNIYAQYRVYQAASAFGIKVILDGQGADELLGGYEPYKGDRLATLLQRGNAFSAACFIKNHIKNSGSIRSLAFAGNSILPEWAIPIAQYAFRMTKVPIWANTEWLRNHEITNATLVRERITNGNLKNALMLGLTKFSIPHLLRYQDRNSMRWSVESRVPFLTKEMASASLSLPESHVISDAAVSKFAFREAMRGIVPDAILNRTDKVGFQTPENGWLKNLIGSINWPNHDFPGMECLNILQTKAYLLKSIVDDNRINWQAWRLVNFILWNQSLNNKS